MASARSVCACAKRRARRLHTSYHSTHTSKYYNKRNHAHKTRSILQMVLYCIEQRQQIFQERAEKWAIAYLAAAAAVRELIPSPSRRTFSQRAIYVTERRAGRNTCVRRRNLSTFAKISSTSTAARASSEGTPCLKSPPWTWFAGPQYWWVTGGST